MGIWTVFDTHIQMAAPGTNVFVYGPRQMGIWTVFDTHIQMAAPGTNVFADIRLLTDISNV
jgi:hypothetical protein